MSRLIYCAHAVLDAAEPDWVQKILENPIVKAEQWCLYRPSLGFMENAKSPGMLSLLSRQPKLSQATARVLQIDAGVFDSLPAVRERVVVADNGPFMDVAFKRLYALLRADVVLVDLDVPDQGCRTVEALYGYLAGIPTVGIASRFIVSPGLVSKMQAVLFPRTSDQIVRQILAFDHKVTATIDHYRDGERRRQQQEHRLEHLTNKIVDLKAEQEAKPDGRNESTG